MKRLIEKIVIISVSIPVIILSQLGNAKQETSPQSGNRGIHMDIPLPADGKCPEGFTHMTDQWGNRCDKELGDDDVVNTDFRGNGDCPDGFWHVNMVGHGRADVCWKATVLNAQKKDSAAILEAALAGKVSCNDPRILGIANTKLPPSVTQKDSNFITCVAVRLIKGNRATLPQGFGTKWLLTPLHNSSINSLTTALPTGQLAVLAFDSMARFLNYDPDEEAFVIAHEIGHVRDWTNCQSLLSKRANQALIMKQQAIAMGQQVCEANADSYGLQYMWGARFNPFAAGAMLGRIEMLLPNQTNGLASTLNNFTSNHPISSERIKKLRELMAQLCSRPGTVCKP
jgi:hypothetical protein